MNDLINIENKILVIRGQQVMLDRDLAEIYGYETKNFNRQVRNNIEKFDEEFMFQLTKEETTELLRCKIFTSNGRGGNRYLPYAFTEQGIYMLMTVLKGDLATKQSKLLIKLFKKMRHYFSENAGIIGKLIEHDQKIDTLFTLMEKYKIEDKQGLFFQGQIYDAHSFFLGLIQKAQKGIILIDNYIDISVLDRLSKKQPNVTVTIYTKPDTSVTKVDVAKFNKQYPALEIKHTNKMHDRFLILDNSEIYHIGASLKDLGKKCFSFTKLEDASRMIADVLRAL